MREQNRGRLIAALRAVEELAKKLDLINALLRKKKITFSAEDVVAYEWGGGILPRVYRFYLKQGLVVTVDVEAQRVAVERLR